MLKKIIKPKVVDFDAYPDRIKSIIWFRFLTTAILVVLLTVFAVIEKYMFLLLLAALVLLMFSVITGYEYYMLTRNLCLILEGKCVEIRRGSAITRAASKVFGAVYSSSVVISIEGKSDKFIIPQKGPSMMKCKQGDPVSVIFAESAMQQNMTGEYMITPMFTIIGEMQENNQGVDKPPENKS